MSAERVHGEETPEENRELSSDVKQCILCKQVEPNEQFVLKKGYLGDGKPLVLTCRTCRNKRRKALIIHELRTGKTRTGDLTAKLEAQHRAELDILSQWLGDT